MFRSQCRSRSVEQIGRKTGDVTPLLFGRSTKGPNASYAVTPQFVGEGPAAGDSSQTQDSQDAGDSGGFGVGQQTLQMTDHVRGDVPAS